MTSQMIYSFVFCGDWQWRFETQFWARTELNVLHEGGIMRYEVSGDLLDKRVSSDEDIAAIVGEECV